MTSFRATADKPTQKMNPDFHLFPPPIYVSVPMSIHHRGSNTFCYIILKSHCNQVQRRLSHEFRDQRINDPLWIWWLDFTFLRTLFRTPNKLLCTSDGTTIYPFPSSGFPSPSFLSPPSHTTPTRFRLRCWGTSPRRFTSRSVWRMHELACIAILDFLQLRIWSTLANY